MGRDVTKLHPFVRMLSEALVKECHRQGMNVKVTECVRTKAEQDDCIRRGTSKVQYPYSYHVWGLAFDVCNNVVGNAFPNDTKWWKRVGTIGKRLGLEWGGDWKDIDQPHFQLNCYSENKNNASRLVRTYGNPQNFFNHSDFKIITPKQSITPLSSKKKILWLQVTLNCQGYDLEIDGIYGPKTIAAVKNFWKKQTGRSCTGKLVKKPCIDLLSNF